VERLFGVYSKASPLGSIPSVFLLLYSSSGIKGAYTRFSLYGLVMTGQRVVVSCALISPRAKMCELSERSELSGLSGLSLLLFSGRPSPVGSGRNHFLPLPAFQPTHFGSGESPGSDLPRDRAEAVGSQFPNKSALKALKVEWGDGLAILCRSGTLCVRVIWPGMAPGR
jgi:hypothetical protein